MSISVEKMRLVLSRFAVLFPLPTSDVSFDSLTEVWCSLLAEYDEAAVLACVRPLALQLRRFPYPADFVERMGSEPS